LSVADIIKDYEYFENTAYSVLTFSSINNIARLNFKLGVPNARAGGLTTAAAARHSNTSYRAVAAMQQASGMSESALECRLFDISI